MSRYHEVPNPPLALMNICEAASRNVCLSSACEFPSTCLEISLPRYNCRSVRGRDLRIHFVVSICPPVKTEVPSNISVQPCLVLLWAPVVKYLMTIKNAFVSRNETVPSHPPLPHEYRVTVTDVILRRSRNKWYEIITRCVRHCAVRHSLRNE